MAAADCYLIRCGAHPGPSPTDLGFTRDQNQRCAVGQGRLAMARPAEEAARGPQSL